MSVRPNSIDLPHDPKTCHFDPRGAHAAFLMIFTYLLQDYRKCLLLFPFLICTGI